MSAGNATIWKPSPTTPLWSIAVTRSVSSVLEKNDIPGAVAGLVTGGKDVGEALGQSREVDMGACPFEWNLTRDGARAHFLLHSFFHWERGRWQGRRQEGPVPVRQSATRAGRKQRFAPLLVMTQPALFIRFIFIFRIQPPSSCPTRTSRSPCPPSSSVPSAPQASAAPPHAASTSTAPSRPSSSRAYRISTPRYSPATR